METAFVEVDGGRLYVELEGDGHPLVLVHGGLGSLRMWDDQAPILAEHFRVLRYDTRGFGRTETEEVEYSETDDLAAVLDLAGADTAYVIGQSRGGTIALDFALARPDRVDALASVAGGISGRKREEPEGTVPPPWDEMDRLWQAKDYEGLADLEVEVWVDGWGEPRTRIDPAVRRRVRDAILEGLRAEHPEPTARPLEPPAVERLGDLRMPLLVVVGTADERGSVLSAWHLSSAVEHARLVELPDVAHMVQLEQPGRFNQLLLEFLFEVEGRGTVPAG
jgi:pimeloyl-ACP methyl ester carboxylesterase